MVKLDASNLRYLSNDEFRVLVAVEMGMRNHSLVPTPLIERIACLRHGGVSKLLGNLLKFKLLHHDAKRYDGYHLTYPGYDYLSLKTFMKRGTVYGLGRQIGIGKESDIYCAVTPDQEQQIVIKFHRLGRVSFKTIKQNRDYLKGRKSTNWLYCSRLSALKEYAFMKALYETGEIPTPRPLDQNRHCVCMEWIDGSVLYQIRELTDPLATMKECLDLIVRLAEYGLIHGDFNEFNLLVKHDDEKIVVIDFPQMVSTSHRNAEMYFDRDIECIHAFFEKKFGVTYDYWPNLEDITKSKSIDVELAASGFSKEHADEFDKIQEELAEEEGGENSSSEEEESDDEENVEETENADGTNYNINEEAIVFAGGAEQNEMTEAKDSENSEDGDEVESSEQPKESGENNEDEDEQTNTETKKRRKKKSIDEEDIKNKVRRILHQRQIRKDNVMKAAKRNVQKGSEKRKIRNALNDEW